jgi:accessory gene regulator protein AgrB
MKNFSLSIITDSLFCCFSFFFLSFIVLNFFIDRAVAIILSVTIALLLTLFTIKFLLKRRKVKLIKRKQQFEQENAMEQLNLSPSSVQKNLFIKVFGKLNEKVEKKKEGLYLPDKKTLIVLKFGYNEVTKADIVKIFNSLDKDQSAHVFAKSFSSETKNFADRFIRIFLKESDYVYSLLKKADVYPETVFVLPKKNIKAQIVSNLFNRKKAKTFFGFGIFFIISSFLVPIKTYYVLSGVLMFLISLSCVFFGKEPKED